MWHGVRASRWHPTLASDTMELLRATSRKLIVIISGAYLAWYFIATDPLPPRLLVGLLPVTFLVVGVSALSLWLLARSLPAALTVWQLGLVAVITQALYVSQEPAVAFAYVLLPLVASVTTHWAMGVLTEGAIVALIWWVAQSPLMPPIPFPLGAAIAASGAVAGLIGWGITYSLLRVIEWSLFSFDQAQDKVNEARLQRVELKQTQEDLILANQELARLSDRLKVMHHVAEEARRAKEEFVANVSHELRTPLNMIIGFSEMITQSPSIYGARLPAPLLADIAAIQRNSQHLANLVDDVLDLSQVEAGRMALSKEQTSLEDIVEAATRVVRPLFDSKQLYLETEVATDLPVIWCDSTRIRQVLINLLSNAGRFTDAGGVRVRARREGDQVVVSVADTGPGISAEDQKKLFEPFQQLDSSVRRRHGGSGLGLNISKRFVEMHGGKLWLESQVGVGTTSSFSLPVDPLPARLPAIESGPQRWLHPYADYAYRIRTRRRKGPAPDVLPRYVLLDGSTALHRLLRRYGEGVELSCVSGANEAQRELQRSPAQALIVNAASTDESGRVLHLADVPFDTPVITCWVPTGDAVAQRLGVAHYLVKPVTREKLVTVLSRLGQGVNSVLVVDDEQEALQLFARMLSSAPNGYRVLQAKTGQMALALLRERKPDVMLLDLIMPGMDGFQVLREKSEDPTIRDIPVVIVSSRDPTGEEIVSNALTVNRAGGLSVRDLLRCVQAVSEILMPSAQAGDRERPETPAG